MAKCILYYITDRRSFSGDGRDRRFQLLEKIGQAASCGVDYIQIREKDLTSRGLEGFARDAMRVLKERKNREAESAQSRNSTSLLINSRSDIALAVGAAGVHLRGDDVTPQDVRIAWTLAGESSGVVGQALSDPIIGVSCRNSTDVARAAANAASFAVFAPVFEKKDSPGSKAAGLEALRQSCREKIPVIALGGVTIANAASCLEAGAAGIAGIRLFQENDIATVVRALRV